MERHIEISILSFLRAKFYKTISPSSGHRYNFFLQWMQIVYSFK